MKLSYSTGVLFYDLLFLYKLHILAVEILWLENLAVLQTPDATQEQIKKAYYNCMKACHPDLSGDDPESTDFCKFINEVYEVGLVKNSFIIVVVSATKLQITDNRIKLFKSWCYRF